MVMDVCVCVCAVNPSDDEDQQEKAFSQMYDAMPDAHPPLDILKNTKERQRIGETRGMTSDLRSA